MPSPGVNGADAGIAGPEEGSNSRRRFGPAADGPLQDRAPVGVDLEAAGDEAKGECEQGEHRNS
jgi:hypothetical protein